MIECEMNSGVGINIIQVYDDVILDDILKGLKYGRYFISREKNEIQRYNATGLLYTVADIEIEIIEPEYFNFEIME